MFGVAQWRSAEDARAGAEDWPSALHTLRDAGFETWALTPDVGATDLWVSQRASVDAPWGAPVNLGPTINSPGPDAAPYLSRDGHKLYFASGRPGGFGSNDNWVSWRSDTHDDFAWQAPERVDR